MIFPCGLLFHIRSNACLLNYSRVSVHISRYANRHRIARPVGHRPLTGAPDENEQEGEEYFNQRLNSSEFV